MIKEFYQIRKIFSVFITLHLLSCAVKPEPAPVWDFAPDGIEINYQADQKLNIYNEKAHTLVMVVYQLVGLDAFNELIKDEEGLKKLLQAGRFDPSVVSANKYIIQPGEKNTLNFDRQEKTRWVGIIGGYYGLIPGDVNCLFEVPYSIEKKGRIRRKKLARIEHLVINIVLGPQAIQKVGSL